MADLLAVFSADGSATASYSASYQTVPEPGTLGLGLMALLGIGALHRAR